MAISDDLLRHRIFLQRLGVGNAKKLRDAVISSVEPLRQAIKKGPLSYLEIIKSITAIRERLRGTLYDITRQDIDEFVLYETGFNLRVLERGGADVVPPTKKDLMSRLDTAKINVSASSDAVTLTALYSLLEKNVINDIKKNIFRIDTQAKTPEVRTEMLESIDSTINTAVTNKVTSVAKTTVNHASEVVMATIVASNIELFDYVQWDTTLDDSVCEDCEALEGQQWPAGEEDETPPLHIGCRCVLTPFTTSEEL